MNDLNTVLLKIQKNPENYLVGYCATTTIAALGMANDFSILFAKDFKNNTEASDAYEKIANCNLERDGKYSKNTSNGVYIREK